MKEEIKKKKEGKKGGIKKITFRKLVILQSKDTGVSVKSRIITFRFLRNRIINDS